MQTAPIEISHKIAHLFSDGRERTRKDVMRDLRLRRKTARHEAVHQLNRIVRMGLLTSDVKGEVLIYSPVPLAEQMKKKAQEDGHRPGLPRNLAEQSQDAPTTLMCVLGLTEPMTARALANHLGRNVDTITKALSALRKQGRITRVGTADNNAAVWARTEGRG